MPIDDNLSRLAALHGVATAYDDYRGEPREVGADTVREVLAALDVDASSAEAVLAAIRAAEDAPWRSGVEPTVVARGASQVVVTIRVPAGTEPDVAVRLERGRTQRPLSDGAGAYIARDVATREIDGTLIAEHHVSLGELPLGYHELTVTAAGRTDSCVLIVAPEQISWPAADVRADGWMLQLYAARSRRSWGIGDLTDLATVAGWSGTQLGMGAVLVNPLHAVAPVHPIQNSPYFPSSKRFANPIYIDPLAVAEADGISDADADELARLAKAARDACAELIDRDAVWAAKRSALELLFARPRQRADAYAAYRRTAGSALDDFATFCALSEVHGGQWQLWAAELHDPQAPDVQKAAAELEQRVEFYRWLQFVCDEQLRAAQDAARAAGMPIGVIHDLAVGVDPGGADSWSMREDLATGVTVGAPPDLYAKQGQDWSQPPLRPDRLRATGYAAFRQMLSSVLRNAGGIRIDHILGLYRLYWIPPGRSATDGTYVHYPVDDMFGVLALEASRAGAVVIGEDLGTVPPGFRDTLHDNGILGSAVLYFEREDDGPVPPESWSAESLAVVNTHDLPTAVGYLTTARVALYEQLGLLAADQVQQEARQAALERDQLVELMVERGLVTRSASLDDLVVGMHNLLAASPCKLVMAALADAVADPRQPNVPGTGDTQYPNWRLPLATGRGHAVTPVWLDDLPTDPRVRRVAAALRAERNGRAR